MKKKISIALAALMAISLAACGSNGNSTDGDSSSGIVEEKGLPDYDAVQAEQMIFNGWFAPKVTKESFQEYKDCGFNYIFLMGQNIGALGGSTMMTAMDYCEELDIKVFVDVTRSDSAILSLADQLVKYDCFVGFNYDEPVIHTNSLNGATGIVELAPYIQALHDKHPEVEFLINLNPCSNVGLPWGTAAFTYEEYLEAQQQYINSIFADTTLKNWISCDDYPLYRDTSSKTEYFLKTTWLQNLEYLAEAKRVSETKLTSNFFIQSMPFGVGSKSRDRIPSYNDLRLQTYALMAYGYDSVSFFCYGTPPGTGEFTEEQYALIDRDGNKTQIYHDTQKLLSEIGKFSNTYMQFNDNWVGTYPILGSNNLAEDDMYYNNSFDCMLSPITNVKGLKGVKALTATEDSIVGYMLDSEGNPGYMVVNYNDTSEEKKSDVTFTFAKYNKAYVYIDGVKQDVTLENNQLTLHLDIGEGVFVIPYVG
ncbi:MAG: hypothetical protein IJX30_05440 [Clostridia bacterium]|nr:hypothetical protein [Clostridia bacterium]